MNGHMYMVWLEESGSEVRKRESCQRMIERNEVVRGQKAVKITGALGRMTTSSGRSASGFTLTEELMKTRPYTVLTPYRSMVQIRAFTHRRIAESQICKSAKNCIQTFSFS